MESDLIPRHIFDREIQVVCVTVPHDQIKSVTQKYKDILLSIPKQSSILPSPNPGCKVLLFPAATPLPEPLLQYESTSQSLPLTYSNFSYHDVLREILPNNLPIPTGFETIGHIAHFNLSPEHFPYKHTIGQVLLDVISTQKTLNIKTVVTKLGKIDNVFRTFQMEVIAGDPDCNTVVVRIT